MARPGMSRSGWRLGLVMLFLVTPLLEIYVLIQVGQVIGAWWTVGLLLLSAVLGSWLIRREGARAWRALTGALRSGRLPGNELTDAGLVLLGGALMVSPGFLTDAVGIVLILPPTRPLFRRALATAVTKRLLVGGPAGPGHRSGDARRPGPGPDESVVRGEVVDDDEESS